VYEIVSRTSEVILEQLVAEYDLNSGTDKS